MSIIAPVILGIFAVLQATLNRKISERWDLAAAINLNGIIFLVWTFSFFIFARKFPHLFPDIFHRKGDFSDFTWWYILPATFGFCFVLGLPWTIHKFGATQVFVGLVASQFVASLLWDRFVDGIPITTLRVLAVSFTLVGVIIGNWSTK